jgi:hypothetical protein
MMSRGGLDWESNESKVIQLLSYNWLKQIFLNGVALDNSSTSGLVRQELA